MNRIREFYNFLKDVYNNRSLLKTLVKNDINSKNAGSLMGKGWIFFQPIVTILVLWFVYQVGFRNEDIGDVEFILWFIPGYLSWTFFNDAVVGATGCFYEYDYLVKKVKFRTSILPIVKVLSAATIHLFFIGFIVAAYLVYGHPIQLIYLQVFYYAFALLFFMIGFSWIVSSIAIFIKDFSQFIGVMLQVGFWFTPVIWNIDTMVKGDLAKVFKANPIFYIVQGYRDTFVYHVPFWQRPYQTIYFWSIALVLFIVGAFVFKKLRPHFADLL